MKSLCFTVIASAVIFFLTACGQKGPLYLPALVKTELAKTY